MKSQQFTKIISVNGDLQAVNVQAALEKAGVPVTIKASDNGLDVMVPAEWADEAHELLNPQRRCGEVYFVPSYPVRLSWSRA